MSSITFERSHGVSAIVAPGGDVVTSISQPTWERFIASVGNVQAARVAQGAGHFILSPELITSTDIGPSRLREARPIIEERIAMATEATMHIPNSTLLLGSAVYDEATERPRNTLLFLKNGMEVDRMHKTNLVGLVERAVFDEPAPDIEVRKPVNNVASIICADIFDYPTLDEEVQTLLVSACWGVASGYANTKPGSDARHTRLLSTITQDLFVQHDNLQTIIMADRLPEGSMLSGPFNFVAYQ